MSGRSLPGCHRPHTEGCHFGYRWGMLDSTRLRNRKVAAPLTSRSAYSLLEAPQDGFGPSIANILIAGKPIVEVSEYPDLLLSRVPPFPPSPFSPFLPSRLPPFLPSSLPPLLLFVPSSPLPIALLPFFPLPLPCCFTSSLLPPCSPLTPADIPGYPKQLALDFRSRYRPPGRMGVQLRRPAYPCRAPKAQLQGVSCRAEACGSYAPLSAVRSTVVVKSQSTLGKSLSLSL